jgi:hypothetical protein
MRIGLTKKITAQDAAGFRLTAQIFHRAQVCRIFLHKGVIGSFL